MEKEIIFGNSRYYLEASDVRYGGYELFRQKLVPGWEKESVLLRRGLESGYESGLMQRGEFLYAKFREPVDAWLKIDLRRAGQTQEVLQNLRLLDFPEGGPGPLYCDTIRNLVCLRENGAAHPLEIADYDGDFRYELRRDETGWYVMALPWSIRLKRPVRHDLNGRASEASAREKAECFWKYIANTGTLIGRSHWETEDDFEEESVEETEEYFENRFRSTVLTLGAMQDIFRDIGERRLWMKKRAFPFEGTLKLLKKAGADPDEDLSDVMYTLHEYSGKVQKDRDGFTPVFYFILYRIAKRKDFLELLRSRPQELFRDYLIEEDSVPSAEEAEWLIKMLKEIDESRPNRVGGFDLADGKLVADPVEITFGTVEGEFVVHYSDRNYRGDVVYDMVYDEPSVRWYGEEDISPYLDEIKKQFRLNGQFWMEPKACETAGQNTEV